MALIAELCYDRIPDLDGEVILAAARVLHPGIELLPPEDAGGPMMFAFPDLAHTFADGVSAALMVAVLSGTGPGPGRDLSQTWDWAEAAQVLQASPHTLLVSELIGRVHPPRQRVEAFGAVVDSIIAMTEPSATWWPSSGRAMAPGDAVSTRLRGLVNVRMFNNTAPPAGIFMDTIGLHALGLPDVEINFGDFKPDQIAGMLYDLAGYLVDGNEIHDGHTVQGLSPDDRWSVRVSQ